MSLIVGRWLILMFVGLGACQAPGGAAAQEPLRILVFGDSLARGLTQGVERALADAPESLAGAEVESLVVIGAGLIPRQRDMRAALAARLGRPPAVDALVVSMGVNDVGMPLGGAAFYGETWRARYAETLRRFAALPAERGIPTVWVEVPALGNAAFAGPIDSTIRPLQAQVLGEAGSGVIYLPTWQLTTRGGAYVSRRDLGAGEPERFREGDGIHFTYRGYVFLGRRILAALTPELALAGPAWPVRATCGLAD
jgi:hypothetical protein